MSHSRGTLAVTIVEGRNLKDEDIIGKNDAYIELYLDKDYKQRTTVVKDSKNPTWNQNFTL
jgi:Ca2+-dependent lipid-binding protein